ncbi:restriction endonuclease subunit S, partial [Methylococcus capsulatus]|uniref:restriction endonuclease subunit S n=1 Tax=Methylococcus capsulatus TaxID=414 RepID=UPI002FD899DB
MSNKADDKAMKPAAKRALVPKLRFPEFREAGEWEKKQLDDFAVIVRGGSPRPIDEYITNDPNGLNWLKIGDIDKESKFVTSTQEKVIPAALSKTRVVNPGDLILSNSMSFGRPYILEIKTCIHDGWIAVSEIDERLDRDFLYYLMMTPASQTYFSNNAAGSGVQNLNADIIKLLPVSYPNKKEQQKIADCLDSLDELVSLEAQKLDTLKAHKKGLMQQLFPRDGETLPQLRFPEFREAGEWDKKAISDACRITQGGTPDTSVSSFWGGTIQWITPAEMGKGNSKYISTTARSITDEGLANCSSELLPANSVILSTRAPIGHLAINQVPMAINQGCRGLIPRSGFDAHFIYYALDRSKAQLNDLGSGNTFKELSGNSL